MAIVKPIPVESPATGDQPAKPHAMPTASPAGIKLRHILVGLAFLLSVVLPSALGAWYLYVVADDQYSSELSFSVQSEDFRSPLNALAGLGQISSGTTSDSEILYEFINSQQIVREIDASLDLRTIFSKAQNDPIFALNPDVSIEELREHWKKRVRVSYEKGSGVVRVEAIAYTAQDAQAINEAIIEESQKLVDRLSFVARQDATRYAQSDLEDASQRLKDARRQLSEFRAQTNIVDPTSDIESRSGVEAALEQQLAEALISKDLLEKSTQDENDPRRIQAQNRIDSIRNRISSERNEMSEGSRNGLIGIVGRFEDLTVEREFAEAAYLSAAAAYDSASAEAKRRTKYLLVHIQPTLADRSLYPQRMLILGLILGFGLLSWMLLVMIGYSLRDRG